MSELADELLQIVEKLSRLASNVLKLVERNKPEPLDSAKPDLPVSSELLIDVAPPLPNEEPDPLLDEATKWAKWAGYSEDDVDVWGEGEDAHVVVWVGAHPKPGWQAVSIDLVLASLHRRGLRRTAAQSLGTVELTLYRYTNSLNCKVEARRKAVPLDQELLGLLQALAEATAGWTKFTEDV